MRKGFLILACLFWISFYESVYAQAINSGVPPVSFEIGSMKVNTVKGNIGGMEGDIRFYPKDPGKSVFEACLGVSTINSGNKKRDKHLLSEDFFQAEAYPRVCFISTSVEKSGEGYVAKGKLTIIETTREVEIPFTCEDGILKGSITLNRLDYLLGKDVGTFKAEENFTVTIQVPYTQDR